MSLHGVVEYIGLEKKYVTGWIKIPGENFNEIGDLENLVTIEVNFNDKFFQPSVQFFQRVDLKSKDFFGLGYRLNIPQIPNEVKIKKFTVSVVYENVRCDLKILEGVVAALNFNELSIGDLNVAMKNLSPIVGSKIVDSFNYGLRQRRSLKKTRPLCIVSYANDSGGWFPYFYKYYANLVGEGAIYIVTPKPENFSKYKLGGVLSVPDMEFDDNARSILMGDFASGLLAYFEWTLVCDVDEIVMPNPKFGVDLISYLKNKNGILLSLGIDVVQCMNEEPFDFSRSVHEQRKYGVLNSALCKPHLSSIPIRYTPGFHYCNKSVGFDNDDFDLLTLHLKWADKDIRKEVSKIVDLTRYKLEKTAQYCKDSVIEEFHPMVRRTFEKSYGLNDSKVKEFKRKYLDGIEYWGEYDFYSGKHFSANFILEL